MKNRILIYLLPVLLCFAVGFIAAGLQTDSLENWYPYLNKPSLTPPDWVFPVAWSFLYLCMGLSLGLILDRKRTMQDYLPHLFIVQLFLNFIWSVLFFYFHSPFWALINIVALEIVLVVYAMRSYRVSLWSSILFIPYIIWIAFATYLNFYIFIHN
ncbi:MAG: tryptophan-rich sensory protein [Bacteroides sp.]|nr:tryptophan-rich sensory protein [Bacteroides sp.]